MFHTLKRIFSAPDPHGPCDIHRQESARLLAELHHSYDREREQRNAVTQLEAENLRLQQDNQTLRLSQQQAVIENLADRILEQKLQRETPALTLPCPHHRTAGLTFAASSR